MAEHMIPVRGNEINHEGFEIKPGAVAEAEHVKKMNRNWVIAICCFH